MPFFPIASALVASDYVSVILIFGENIRGCTTRRIILSMGNGTSANAQKLYHAQGNRQLLVLTPSYLAKNCLLLSLQRLDSVVNIKASIFLQFVD